MTLDGARRRGRSRFDTTTRVVAVVSLGIGLLGCGSSASSAPSVAPTASVAPIASAQATVPVTAAPTEAGAAEPCSTAPNAECPMVAGEYHASRIAGGITFTLSGDAWTNNVYEPEILSMFRDDEWVVFMFGEVGLDTGDRLKLSSDPEAAREHVDKLPGMTATSVDETITIAGQDAVVFDVASTGDGTEILWWLGETSGRYELGPGASVRMHWLEVDGQPFILALESSTDSFEAMLRDSMSLIGSVAFDD